MIDLEMVQISEDPEEYDVFLSGRRVGYMRLRNSHFTVQCPDVSGEYVLENSTYGSDTLDPSERDFFLRMGLVRIRTWLYARMSNHERARLIEHDTE